MLRFGRKGRRRSTPPLAAPVVQFLDADLALAAR
jgi:hypothetical protein